MANFFAELKKQGLLLEWADILDWLLNDSKFPTFIWSNSLKRNFIDRLRREFNITDNNWKTGRLADLVWDNVNDINNTLDVFVQMNVSKAQCMDLVRHIRNGIVHNNVEFVSVKTTDKNWIIIKDYQDEKKQKQTAFIFIPLAFISYLYSLYCGLEELSMKNMTQNVIPEKDTAA